VEREEIRIDVDGTEISIRGERRFDPLCSEESYHRLESARGRFHRIFSLPEVPDKASLNATLTDGVLQVLLSKSPKSRRLPARSMRGRR